MRSVKNNTAITIICLIMMFYSNISNASQSKIYQIHGKTMGNSYSISLVSNSFSAQQAFDLRNLLEYELEVINSVMSTWLKESEINKINRANSNETIKISNSLREIITQSQQIEKMTSGAFDITVAPLVKLWGFGPDGIPSNRPQQQQIDEVKAYTGSNKFKIQENVFSKIDKRLQLDLSGIAKGYAVDILATKLEKNGFSDYLVEIGGEIYAKGTKPNSAPWVIAIEHPRKTNALTNNIINVNVNGIAVATSGDYRNYFESQGTRFSHVINPKTGWASQSNVISATVIASKCATADALATASMVMGAKEAIEFADKYQIAIMIIEDNFGSIKTYQSKNFDQYTNRITNN